MCYLEKIEYEIVPIDSLSVIRNCSGCGKKSYFINTKRFRVNANGNRLDVWLIYQCKNCKHTYNLAIYERAKVSSLPEKEYQRLLSNDEQLAEMYGRNHQLFKKNKAKIDLEAVNYQITRLRGIPDSKKYQHPVEIRIYNPCGLKIRSEKQIAEVLSLSRSQVKKMMERGDITVQAISPQVLSVSVNTYFFHMEEN
ncbi:MAG: DUF1062 domain-containing protein [Lachnospiraceae bacterium]|nr:DUF1062 domain-containing protein [Lachnospiraceae bacterium]